MCSAFPSCCCNPFSTRESQRPLCLSIRRGHEKSGATFSYGHCGTLVHTLPLMGFSWRNFVPLELVLNHSWRTALTFLPSEIFWACAGPSQNCDLSAGPSLGVMIESPLQLELLIQLLKSQFIWAKRDHTTICNISTVDYKWGRTPFAKICNYLCGFSWILGLFFNPSCNLLHHSLEQAELCVVLMIGCQ